MDLIPSDNDHRRVLLSFLLMQCADELSDWVKSQGELGASGIPVDDMTWETPEPVKIAAEARQVESAKPDEAKRMPISRPDFRKNEKCIESGTSRSMASFMALNSSASHEVVKSASERLVALGLLKAQASSCRKCALGFRRKGILWGIGPSDASIVFVAAGGNPAELDAGRVMTGDAAALFDKIVSAMEVLHKEAAPDRIYMTNAIKCACIPAKESRMDTAKSCLSFLREEVRIIHPKVIVIWGEMAYRAMFGGDQLISQVRGKILNFDGIPAIPTHHPMEMIKNVNLKGRVWGDLKLAISLL